jgi:hypothetical protein
VKKGNFTYLSVGGKNLLKYILKIILYVVLGRLYPEQERDHLLSKKALPPPETFSFM